MERLTIGRRVARGFSVKKTLTFPLEIRGEMKQIGNSGGSVSTTPQPHFENALVIIS